MVLDILYRTFIATKRVGIRRFLREMWYTRQFRAGNLIGIDNYGNEYYEVDDFPKPPDTKKSILPFKGIFHSGDNTLPYYRRRYVIYGDGGREPSSIPPEWHGWIHQTRKDPPHPSSYSTNHRSNPTGTSNRFMPYSTTKPTYQELLCKEKEENLCAKNNNNK